MYISSNLQRYGLFPNKKIFDIAHAYYPHYCLVFSLQQRQKVIYVAQRVVSAAKLYFAF